MEKRGVTGWGGRERGCNGGSGMEKERVGGGGSREGVLRKILKGSYLLDVKVST